jgi:hypothetical protein|nr:MAG: hypothetical protein DIU67_02750 [Actinomycetota bacterium]
MRSLTRSVVALCLLVGACSPAAEPTTTTSSTIPTTSTTSTVATTTTTALPSDLSPLTGLPVSDPELIQRQVLAVKIDNHPQAVPQSGVEQADVVIEMLVEGITRFLTLWLESDSGYLGPMRSGRPTDATLLAPLNHPTFARSGAQDWVQTFISNRDVHQVGEIGGDATFRVSHRSSPHNLYVSTIALREWADARGYPSDPPDPIWEFGPLPSSARPASHVRLDFNRNIVEWTWDEDEGLWLRTAYNRDSMWIDRDGKTGRLGAPVLVAFEVEMYQATPDDGQVGTPVPASKTTGTGRAWVLADGRVVEGTWKRPDEKAGWFVLEDPSGNTIPIPPGRPWISLVPATGGLTYEP